MAHILKFSKEARRGLKKLKQRDKVLFERVEREIRKILENPEVGKPLRYSLKHHRRVRVGSFVLVYEILNDEIRLADFDHHDKIYKK